MFDLSGEVAVVTGGNGGIGRGIALGLAEAGAAVAILARNEQKNNAVVAEIKRLGAKGIAVQLDVTKRDALKPAMEEVERELGPVSITGQQRGNHDHSQRAEVQRRGLGPGYRDQSQFVLFPVANRGAIDDDPASTEKLSTSRASTRGSARRTEFLTRRQKAGWCRRPRRWRSSLRRTISRSTRSCRDRSKLT